MCSYSASYPKGFCIIYDVTPWGYEAGLSNTSKSIKNSVGTHGFAKLYVPTAVCMLFEAWGGLASYPQGFCTIYDVNPLGV
jgi:hypothetical protein